jgi:hypothetical protein
MHMLCILVYVPKVGYVAREDKRRVGGRVQMLNAGWVFRLALSVTDLHTYTLLATLGHLAAITRLEPGR